MQDGGGERNVKLVVAPLISISSTFDIFFCTCYRFLQEKIEAFSCYDFHDAILDVSKRRQAFCRRWRASMPANAAPHMTRDLSLVLLFHARNNIFRTPLLIFRPLPVVPDFRKHPSKGGVKGTFFQVFPREGKPCVVANAIIGIRATFFSSREYFSAAQLLSDHPDKMYQKKGNVVLPYSVSMLPKNLQVTRRQNILL